jgi:LmbE family N-acetylglucosaminyl deacetylase
MFQFGFSGTQQPIRQILCLGAHSDDIEIGCGGTLLKLTQTFPDACVDWIVFSGADDRVQEAKVSAEAFLEQARRKNIVVKNFRDGFFPYDGAEIKRYFEQLKQQLSPDLIFTHCRHDLHQDHRVIAELTWNTFRDHCILEYEIPKYDGDLRSPNVFVHLSKSLSDQKVDYLLRHFGTQANKHWFTEELFLSLLRIRGIESRAPEFYAEAFYGRKIVL